MSEELKPCPFCGQQDAFVEQLDSDASVVICQGMVDEHSACLARGPVGVQQSDLEDQPGRDAAIAEWNRRAQPAEAEGVSNARLMNTLAELARRAPLRTLHTICETQHQVSTVKLERYLEPVGDTLAGYAFTLRIDFDKLSAALSAVTAERDMVAGELSEIRVDVSYYAARNEQLRAEVEALRADAERFRWLAHQGDACQWMNIIRVDPDDFESYAEAVDAAMAAKEA